MAKGMWRGVDNVARKLKKRSVGVGNVSRNIKKRWRGVDGIARQTFQSGTPLEEFAVGDSVYLNINEVATEFLIVHQGLPSSLYDSSCDGIWLLAKYPYEQRAWHYNDVNQYHYSDIHTYLNGDFLALFDAGVQDIIKQAIIPYCPGYGSSGVSSASAGLSAKIFLLSGYEVGYTTSDNSYFPVDGSCLDYFVFDLYVSQDEKRTAYQNSGSSTGVNWWTRSPKTNETGTAWIVCHDGTKATSAVSSQYYIRPALILPSDTAVDPDTLMIE